jgi:hypothetical protein
MRSSVLHARQALVLKPLELLARGGGSCDGGHDIGANADARGGAFRFEPCELEILELYPGLVLGEERHGHTEIEAPTHGEFRFRVVGEARADGEVRLFRGLGQGQTHLLFGNLPIEDREFGIAREGPGDGIGRRRQFGRAKVVGEREDRVRLFADQRIQRGACGRDFAARGAGVVVHVGQRQFRLNDLDFGDVAGVERARAASRVRVASPCSSSAMASRRLAATAAK